MEFSDELDRVLYEGGEYIGSVFFYHMAEDDVLEVTSYDNYGEVSKTRKFKLVEVTD